MEVDQEPLDIVSQAFCMAAAVERFMEQARSFYYTVMLSGHPCPGCGGNLEMVSEGACRCRSCGSSFDPTVTFQRCESCGGKPRLIVRRYQCSRCGQDVASRFLFDGLVFDADYFREKMAESRERKRELRERVRQMLAHSRSPAILPEPVDLAAMHGLLEALDGLVKAEAVGFDVPLTPAFSLNRYQSHVQAHIRPFPMSFDLRRFRSGVHQAGSGFMAIDHDADVVPGTCPQGTLDQFGCQAVETRSSAEVPVDQAGDLRVGTNVGEAVAAEEDQVVVGEAVGMHRDVNLLRLPQAAGDEMGRRQLDVSFNRHNGMHQPLRVPEKRLSHIR